MEQYNISGMSCAACQARIEKAVSSLEGVKSCAVSLLTNSLGVEGTASSEEIIRAVEKAGYGASIKSSKSASASQQKNDGDHALEDRESPVILKRLIASLVFLLPLLYVSMGHMLWDWPLPSFLKGNHVAMGLYQLVLSALVMVINQKFFISGFRAIFHRAPNMDSLVALGATASFLYSLFALFAMTSAVLLQDEEKVIYYMKQFYFESAAMILTLITVGKLLEAKSKGKTTSALKALMKLSPKTAVLLIDGQEKEVPVEQVKPGDIFLVRPGDSIPVDGIVVKGESAVNESALTGESIPVEKETGSEVSAATINTWGYMECRASRVGQDTTLSAIIRMVSDAAATKAPIAKIADKVSGFFVPLVILIALVTFAAWLFAGQSVGYAIARAVSVLVISCPCALGLATPVAIMVGSGLAARNGILFKTAASLEQAGKSKIIALDKTGTITSGVMKVTDIISFDEDLLSLAYALEVKSEHPISRAIVEYAESQKLELCETSDFEVLSGKGLKARLADKKGNITSCGISGGQDDNHEAGLKGAYEETWEGGQIGGQKLAPEVGQKLSGKSMLSEDELAGGNQTFISSLQITLSQENKEELSKLSSEGKTPVLFAKGNKLLGIIALADKIKEDSKKAVNELKSMGLHTVMLTGDNQLTAQAIGKQAGIDEIIADVKPDQKEEHIKRLMEKGKVTMVGDGINDAPALTRADLGIAIGAGTDVAIDAADVVLIKGSLMDLVAAIKISRATLRNIHENLFWAFFYNIIGIPLAAGCYVSLFGWELNPMFGAAAMGLSSFCVVSNALRLNFVKLPVGKKLKEKITSENDGFSQNSLLAKNEIENKENIKEGGKMKIKVNGMMCSHCEAHVKKALEAVDGVKSALASHQEGTVTIESSKPVEESLLEAAVKEAGYEYAGIIQ